MLRASVHCCQLLFLSQVWHVVCSIGDVTAEVVATCYEDALLPCQVVQNPQVTYKEISWYKINEISEELLQVEWKKLQHKEQVSKSKWYSLSIKNTTNNNSGTYKCILETSDRKYNSSNTITLIVKGCPEQLEEAKFKKHRTELLLLCSLGLFYLLLMFFACRCLKEKGSQDFQTSRKRHISNRLLVSSTYQKNDSNSTDKQT